MSDPLAYLAKNTEIALFLAVFAEQAGAPLPATPFLVAAGALVATGRVGLAGVLAACVVSSLLANSIWYALGRRYGTRVLNVLCRVSLEPDSCVRNTQDGFARHGSWLLILGKFVPGLGTVAPPLAAVVGISLPRFLVFDAAGTLAWSLSFLAAGYFLGGPIGRALQWLATEGGWAVLAFGSALAAWLGWKTWRRRRVLRELRIARVTPADLKERIDAGDPVVIIDLRHVLDQELGVLTLPGALRMQPQELEARHGEIPRDRDVVLFCT